MTIDEIKLNWQTAGRSIKPGPDRWPDDGRKTALQRLGDRYKRFAILEVISMITGPLVLWNVGVTSMLIIASYVLYMASALTIDQWLMRSIRAIDPSTMSVTEVLKRTMTCRKVHMWWIVGACPFALLWCLALEHIMQANSGFVYGMLVGGVVGVVIGIRALRDFLREYRRVMED